MSNFSNKSINDSVSVNLTPDNEFNTMHSITKVSIGTVINEEFGLTMQVHGLFLMDNSHGLITIIVLLQIYSQFRFIKYSTNLCFTIFFLNQLKLLSSNNYHIYIYIYMVQTHWNVKVLQIIVERLTLFVLYDYNI